MKKHFFLLLMLLAAVLFFVYSYYENRNIMHEKGCDVDFIINNVIIPEEFSFPFYYALKDENGNIHTVDSIFTEPLLVFRFCENNCELCIQSELNVIRKTMRNENIIGLASYNTLRSLRLAKEKFNIDFPVFFLPRQESELVLPNSLEKTGMPYLFFMNTNYQAKHIFLPDKQYPDVSTRYYNVISHTLNLHQTNPEIFDEKVIDLGIVKVHKLREIKFQYTNKLSEPLIIHDVRTSCGCSVPQWNKKPLEKNESSVLTVLFTPESLGYNSKTIMVSHNQSENPVQLFFKAMVEE